MRMRMEAALGAGGGASGRGGPCSPAEPSRARCCEPGPPLPPAEPVLPRGERRRAGPAPAALPGWFRQFVTARARRAQAAAAAALRWAGPGRRNEGSPPAPCPGTPRR